MSDVVQMIPLAKIIWWLRQNFREQFQHIGQTRCKSTTSLTIFCKPLSCFFLDETKKQLRNTSIVHMMFNIKVTLQRRPGYMQKR